MAERCTDTSDMFSQFLDATQIKAILKEKGWTQTSAAEYFGTDKDWLNE